MKRILIIFLICLIGLTGCNEKEASPNKDELEIIDDKSNTIIDKAESERLEFELNMDDALSVLGISSMDSVIPERNFGGTSASLYDSTDKVKNGKVVEKNIEISQIDAELIDLIKSKILLECELEKIEGIKWYSREEIHPEDEIRNNSDKSVNYYDDTLYFDLDNDSIKDKFGMEYASIITTCELYWGEGNGKYIHGDLRGGIYGNKEKDETANYVGELRFLEYKGINYRLDCIYGTADRLTCIELYLYLNKELIDKVRLEKNVTDSIVEVEYIKDLLTGNTYEIEGKELLKDYDGCAYPKICFGTAEIMVEEGQDVKCDINNDNIEEYCHKSQCGGFEQLFSYSINGAENYLDKYGLTYEKIGVMKGFWIDKGDKNVLKVISYKGNKYYFRCYILEGLNANEIFRMVCCPTYEVLIK